MKGSWLVMRLSLRTQKNFPEKAKPYFAALIYKA